mmetsp:Transcript_6327/g.24616  ORF Transcript_6327/g.24616 Transcript_6327/m.24616 type:complete len:378 (-) Transcript_6327:2-1135(-)
MIVMTDESYVHSSHRSNFSFQKEGQELESIAKGQRVCILHAISPAGPILVAEGGLSAETAPRAYFFTGKERRTMHKCQANLGKTSELFFPARKTGDYHDSMNTRRFMEWLTEQFLPSFQSMFPDKKPCVVMDNAAYHWCSEMSEKLASASTKAHYYDILVEEGAKTIKCPRGEEMIAFEVNDTLLKKGGGSTCPTSLELKDATVRWLRAHKPHKMKSMAVRAIEEVGGRVIWLPPYCPFFNAIETFWAIGKNRAADAYEHHRSVEQVIEDVRRGWYGDNLQAPADCAALFGAAHAEMNARIERLEGLSGSIHQLTVSQDAEIETLASEDNDRAWETAEASASDESGESDLEDLLVSQPPPGFDFSPALAMFHRRWSR